MSEEKKFFTRMGDGSPVYMTEEEIRSDMKAGIDDAVLRGKIDPLSDEELQVQNLVNRLFSQMTPADTRSM